MRCRDACWLWAVALAGCGVEPALDLGGGDCPDLVGPEGSWRSLARVEGAVAGAAVEGCRFALLTASEAAPTPTLLVFGPDIDGTTRPLPPLPPLAFREGRLVTGRFPGERMSRVDLSPSGPVAVCSSGVLVEVDADRARWVEGPREGARCFELAYDGAGQLVVAWSWTDEEGVPRSHLARREPEGWFEVGTPSGAPVTELVRMSSGDLSLAWSAGLRRGLATLAPGAAEAAPIEVEDPARVRRIHATSMGGLFEQAEGWLLAVDASTGAAAALDAPAGAPSLTSAVHLPAGIAVLGGEGSGFGRGVGPTSDRLHIHRTDEGWRPAGEALVSSDGWGRAVLVGVDALGRPVALVDDEVRVGPRVAVRK